MYKETAAEDVNASAIVSKEIPAGSSLNLADVVNAQSMDQSADYKGEWFVPQHAVKFESVESNRVGYQGDLRSTWRGTLSSAQTVPLDGLRSARNAASDDTRGLRSTRREGPKSTKDEVGDEWAVSEGTATRVVAFEYLEDTTPFNTSRVNTYGNRVTTNFPYRAIGRLGIQTATGSGHCTGTLIGPSIVLTAAHCVSEYGGDFFESFVFVPGYDNGVAPYGVWDAEYVLTSSSYIEGTSFCAAPGIGCANDVALLRLESRTDRKGKEYRLGEKIGWLGFGFNGYGANFDGSSYVALVSQFGYPGSHDGGHSMQRTDAQARYEAEIDMAVAATRQTQGSSGGPWIVNYGQHAELSGGITLGSDAASNTVLAVTSAGNGTGRVLASWLNESNFTFLYDELCSQNSADCEYSRTTSENPAVRVSLEEPVNGQTYSGIGNLRGWALYDFGIDFIEVYIDGAFAFMAPYGGARSDVGNAFPNIADSENSGFGLTFNYGNLPAGEHEITVAAVTKTGEYAISRSRFFVDRYHKPFIEPNDQVSVDSASFLGAGDRVEFLDVIIDGRTYDVTLEWQTATQSFSTVSIESAE